MARYESQVIVTIKGDVSERALIPDSGTSVTVEFFNGSEWVEDSQSPISSPDSIFCRNLSVRLTPDLGGFFFDDAEF